MSGLLRGQIERVDASLKLPTAQVSGYKDEPDDGVEVFAQYGLTAIPPDATGAGKGVEAIVAMLGDTSDHPVILAVGDRRYGVHCNAKGEVCIWDDQGQKVYLKRDRILVEAPIVEVKSPDVRLGDGADSQGVRWTELKTWLETHTHVVANVQPGVASITSAIAALATTGIDATKVKVK